MRAVIQRVTEARVDIQGRCVGKIQKGLLILVAASKNDGLAQIEWMVKKIHGLRIFSDENGKLNLDIQDIGGSALIVSQFTLYGNCRKGKRPSYAEAAPSFDAEQLYNEFVKKFIETGIPVETGEFGKMMQVYLVNDGPVTLILDAPENLD
jgi:D-aminoacyl-tRNA deacylase